MVDPIANKLQSVRNTTHRLLENAEAPPIDRCSFTRNIMNIDKLLLSADQFTCDLGNPQLDKPCRWKRTSELRSAASQTWTRRQPAVVAALLPFGMDSSATQATVFDAYVHAGRWWTRRTQQGEKERGQARPNPNGRSIRWNDRPGPHDAPRKRPIDGA